MNDGEDPMRAETKEYLVGMEKQIRKLEQQLAVSGLMNYFNNQVRIPEYEQCVIDYLGDIDA